MCKNQGSWNFFHAKLIPNSSTDTDMGGTHCQSALYRYLQNDKKTRILLAAGNNAEAHTDVLH